MSGFIADRLRGLAKDLVRAQRRLSTSDLEGVVVEQDAGQGKIRMKIGTDPASGEDVLGPWVKVQALANQAGFKFSAPLPPVGTRMRLVSPSGNVGAASYAAPSWPDEGLPGPAQAPGEAVLVHGKTSMSIKDGTIVMNVNGKGYTLTADGLQMTNKFTAQGGSHPTEGNSNLLA